MRDVSQASIAGPSAGHALTFRVMRLTTPLPAHTNTVPFTTVDPDGPASQLFENAPKWEGEGAPCGVSSLTVLPSSFGSIYASETFRSFISVFNRSADAVESVAISILMQTSSQHRVQLFDSSNSPRPVLSSRACISNIVEVPLPELGVHVLVCTATYIDNSSSVPQTRTLRQFFRFNVLPPLEPSLSVIPLYKGLQSFPFTISLLSSTPNYVHYLVDLRVLNAMPMPVYETKVTFLPTPPFRTRALLRKEQTLDMDDEVESLFRGGRYVSMGVGDVRNFMFHVFKSISHAERNTNSASIQSEGAYNIEVAQSSQTTTYTDASAAANRAQTHILTSSPKTFSPHSEQRSGIVTQCELGQMNITWRSALGERGHLENIVTVPEQVEGQSDIEVSVYAVPKNIRTHHPFVVQCAARNNRDHAVRLYLQVRRDLVGEIVPVGVSGVSLGEVLPGHTAQCSITMIPLVRGKHTISGVRVVDIDSKVSYKAEAPLVSVS